MHIDHSVNGTRSLVQCTPCTAVPAGRTMTQNAYWGYDIHRVATFLCGTILDYSKNWICITQKLKMNSKNF